MSLKEAIKKQLGRRDLATGPLLTTDATGSLIRRDSPEVQPAQRIPQYPKNWLEQLRSEEIALTTQRVITEKHFRTIPIHTDAFYACRRELSEIRAKIRAVREQIKDSSNAIH